MEPALTVEYVRERAKCARCGKKWIGAVQMYEPRLGLGPGLQACEIRLIASAVSAAAEVERKAADAIGHASEGKLELSIFGRRALFESRIRFRSAVGGA